MEIGFDPAYFDALAAVEERSFWFRSRSMLIVSALRRHAPAMRSFLEVGCGNGIVLQAIRRAFPNVRLTGAEPFARGLEHARQRVPDAEWIEADAMHLPAIGPFDAAGAFDVIEHIDDDVLALREIASRLAAGGTLVLTVPQHPRLWSGTDVFAHHRRRYRRRELVEKLDAAGFDVRYATSFVSLLLPAMWLARRKSGTEAPEVALPRIVNALLGVPMAIERAAIGVGVRFPAGGSLLIVAAKR
jgi:SAM-dependent methyltransferase